VLAIADRRGDDAGVNVNDPGLEERRRTGRRVILVAGCLAPLALVIPIVVFLAIWQFLAPTERTGPPPRTSPPSGSP
jgi:hypothetical protein